MQNHPIALKNQSYSFIRQTPPHNPQNSNEHKKHLNRSNVKTPQLNQSQSRSRIYSYQGNTNQHTFKNNKNITHAKIYDDLYTLSDNVKNKLKNVNTMHKQSNGIMNQPPDYQPNKYTFKNDNNLNAENSKGCFQMGFCCTMLKQTQKEVYLSPTQLISAGYFYKNLKTQPKSLRFKKQVQSHSIQKSFFKEASNIAQ